jgi:hypothetical protein
VTPSIWDVYDVPLGLEIGLPSGAFVAAFIHLAERHRTGSEDGSNARKNRQPAARRTESGRTATVLAK